MAESATATPVIEAPATTASATVERPAARTGQRGVTRSERLLSLDVFRGVTIAGMLLVNNPGDWGAIYKPLAHALWNGWTPTDLIFPFFLFIVGVSMTFSFAKARENGAARGDLLKKSLKRAALIFLVGLLIHGFPHYIAYLPTLRIPGVLQRIAICFAIASIIVLYADIKGIVSTIAALLLGYWMLQTLVPVPDTGFAGVLKPSMDLGAYIDRAVFGTKHMWIESKTWDPEGLLSSLPAVGTALLGVLAGYWIRSNRSASEKLVGLFVAGNIGLVAGIIWGQVFPINKSLWTSSYVIFTAGMACHFLAMCYYLIDVKGSRWWTRPFVVFGMNAIAAFFLSAVIARSLNLIKVAGPDGTPIALKTLIFRTAYVPYFSPLNASLAYAITFDLFLLAILWVMYSRKIFLKL
jgi:predicted acyltransferase